MWPFEYKVSIAVVLGYWIWFTAYLNLDYFYEVIFEINNHWVNATSYRSMYHQRNKDLSDINYLPNFAISINFKTP